MWIRSCLAISKKRSGWLVVGKEQDSDECCSMGVTWPSTLLQYLLFLDICWEESLQVHSSGLLGGDSWVFQHKQNCATVRGFQQWYFSTCIWMKSHLKAYSLHLAGRGRVQQTKNVSKYSSPKHLDLAAYNMFHYMLSSTDLEGSGNTFHIQISPARTMSWADCIFIAFIALLRWYPST